MTTRNFFFFLLTKIDDTNGLGYIGDTFGDPNMIHQQMPLSAVPSSLASSSNQDNSGMSSNIGANPRISTVDEEEYLEDLLNMDPV